VPLQLHAALSSIGNTWHCNFSGNYFRTLKFLALFHGNITFDKKSRKDVGKESMRTNIPWRQAPPHDEEERHNRRHLRRSGWTEWRVACVFQAFQFHFFRGSSLSGIVKLKTICHSKKDGYILQHVANAVLHLHHQQSMQTLHCGVFKFFRHTKYSRTSLQHHNQNTLKLNFMTISAFRQKFPSLRMT